MTAPALPFRLPAAQLELIAANFLMWGGFFAVIPLVTVPFVDGRGERRQLTQHGPTVFGGAWADRTGPRPLILAGCLIRTPGFSWMGFAESLPALLAASVLAGIGGGLFGAPGNAAHLRRHEAGTPRPDVQRDFSRGSWAW